MPQGCLRPALRDADDLRPLRPRIAVAVKRDAFDFRPFAEFAKIIGANAIVLCEEAGKERPAFGQVLQDFLQPLADYQTRGRQIASLQLPSDVGEDAIYRIDVLVGEACRVGLTRAGEPQQS